MLIPSRALVLIAIGPVLLSLGTLFEESLIHTTLLVDGAVVVLALVDALLGRGALVSVERRTPQVMSIGRPNTVTLTLRSQAKRRLAVSVNDDLFEDARADELPLQAELGPRGRAEVTYRVIPKRRGSYELGDHFIRYASPLGLWTRQLRIHARSPIRVYPDIQAVRAYELMAMKDRTVAGVRATRKRGGESEFERLRDYRRGDEYRSIDWRATARHSKLIAREYQLERNQNVMFLLDAGRLMTAEVGGISLFDHALNATLMLSHVASKTGDHVGLLAFSDSVKSFASPEGGAQASRRLVQASYELHPELCETSYGSAVEYLSSRVKKRSLVVLFTQLVDDVAAAELLKLMRGLSPRHLPLIVPFRDMDIDALALGNDPETRSWEEPSGYLRAAAAELISFRDRLLREVRRRGALVLDVPPTDLTPALINKYLEIKARHLL